MFASKTESRIAELSDGESFGGRLLARAARIKRRGS
jgi:hypothetical protein